MKSKPKKTRPGNAYQILVSIKRVQRILKSFVQSPLADVFLFGDSNGIIAFTFKVVIVIIVIIALLLHLMLKIQVVVTQSIFIVVRGFLIKRTGWTFG